MTEISQRQLRNDNADIMRRVENGESFTVTRNGRAVGRLEAVPDNDDSPFVAIDGLVASASALPPVDYQAFRRDLGALVDNDVEL